MLLESAGGAHRLGQPAEWLAGRGKADQGVGRLVDLCVGEDQVADRAARRRAAGLQHGVPAGGQALAQGLEVRVGGDGGAHAGIGCDQGQQIGVSVGDRGVAVAEAIGGTLGGGGAREPRQQRQHLAGRRHGQRPL